MAYSCSDPSPLASFIVLRRVDGVLAGTDGVLHRISTTPVRHRRASVPHQYDIAACQHDATVSLSLRRRRDAIDPTPSPRDGTPLRYRAPPARLASRPRTPRAFRQ
mmetsp:Transcript_8054/g.25220  ORF Transcript_8054/g.25220 Transcript_8054/m.25220 type:complete len:106 (-) Transcript_8054:648-965(-)